METFTKHLDSNPLISAQAANRGGRRKRNWTDLATIGESVVPVFLKWSCPISLFDSVPEMPHAGEDHDEIELIRGGDYLCVLHRSTGLDKRSRSIFRRQFQTIGKREEGIRGYDSAIERQMRLLSHYFRTIAAVAQRKIGLMFERFYDINSNSGFGPRLDARCRGRQSENSSLEHRNSRGIFDRLETSVGCHSLGR